MSLLQIIAKAVGKDRSTVANLLRLLKLPLSIRKLVEEGSLTQGHARALLSLEDPVRAGDLARKAVKEGWSVREVERRVAGAAGRKKKKAKPKDPVVAALEKALASHFQTRVTIKEKKGQKGTIEVEYHDAQDFERIFEGMTGRRASEVIE